MIFFNIRPLHCDTRFANCGDLKFRKNKRYGATERSNKSKISRARIVPLLYSNDYSLHVSVKKFIKPICPQDMSPENGLDFLHNGTLSSIKPFVSTDKRTQSVCKLCNQLALIVKLLVLSICIIFHDIHVSINQLSLQQSQPRIENGFLNPGSKAVFVNN